MGEGLFLLQIWKWPQTYALSLIYCVAFTGMMKQILAVTIYRHTTVNTNKCAPDLHTHTCTNALRLCALFIAQMASVRINFSWNHLKPQAQEEHAAVAAAPPISEHFEFVRLIVSLKDHCCTFYLLQA